MPDEGLGLDPVSLSMEIDIKNPSVSFRESRRKLVRVDMYHIPILKGQKMHKVTFKDELKGGDQQLTKVYIVENYSKYHQTTDQRGCRCLERCEIF